MSSGSKRKAGLREVVIGIAMLAVLALLALPVIRNTMNAKLDRTCAGNLQEWGTIHAMYRAENSLYGVVPHGYETYGPASNMPGCTNIDDAFDFAPDVRLIFPEYATDPAILACPDAGGVVPAMTLGPLVVRPPRLDPKTFGIAQGSCDAAGTITRPGAGYTYLGFIMVNAGDDQPQISEDQARQIGLPATGPANVVALLEQFHVDEDTTFERAQAKRNAAYNRADYMRGLGWPYEPYGGDLAYAMVGPIHDTASASDAAVNVAGIDTEQIKSTYSSLAVMWDTIHQDASGNPVFNHSAPGGCNVLFMDGHVEFVQYPGPFPLTKTFATMKAVK